MRKSGPGTGGQHAERSHTLEAIGQRFNLSGERVRVIVNKEKRGRARNARIRAKWTACSNPNDLTPLFVCSRAG